jgi:formate-nitrite transporter family protein
MTGQPAAAREGATRGTMGAGATVSRRSPLARGKGVAVAKQAAAQEKHPRLGAEERAEAQSLSPPRPVVIHEVVREQGEEEIERPTLALAVSGFAAGLSMGFSFLVMAMIWAHLPDAPWRLLLAAPGYAAGFLIVILGRQQLFTEKTLTAILPLFTRPGRETLFGAARVWAVVLLANLAGTWLFAWVLSHEGVFSDATWQALTTIARQAGEASLFAAFMKAIMAGWLIALMVWLLPGAGSAHLFVIIILTTIVALGIMPHVIAGSVEAAWSAMTGQSSLGRYVAHFLLPTLVGNTAGGVALTALLNHAPIATELQDERA